MYQRTETVIVTPQFDALSAPRVATQRPTAELLIIRVPAITSDMTNAEVMDTFGEHRELVSLPVLERGKPIGLISRNIFMSQMSRPYYRELYEKKSCIAFMDKAPLIVEADTPIETLAARAVASGDKTLVDGFLIVQDGAFAGVGAGLDLMQVLVDLQTEKTARSCKALTMPAPSSAPC
ncbi:CBS domain-containing protein [Neopusillimonas aromaticivorans]|uniref:CBS domain-containing protein n=1 Tax=Neopusillimonas aromaticivorans TaxID=2979868 RepID=UPI003315AE2C